MKLNTNIKSIKAEIQRGKLLVWSKTPLKILSFAVLNGGLRDANGIMSVQVPEDCGMDIADEVHRNPEDFLRKEASKLNLSQDKVVGLMTAADLQNAEVTSRKYEDVTLSVLVTAGISFSATAGDKIASKYGSFRFKEFGTINIIVLIDGNLTESCMVNVMNTVTEAKTVALKELDIRSRFSGDLASGTVTDSVVVACTKRGSPIKYAGTATMIGELVGKSVKESVKKVIHKQENLVPNRPLTKRLEERGISIADMTTLFSQVHPNIRENAEKWSQFTEELQRVLSDQNIGSLVIAGLRLDEDAKLGLIPEIPVNACDEKFVVCEILQTAVADYLSKKDVTSRYVGLDDLSSAVADKLGLFTRSILFAVMKGVYSNVVANR
ncbi:adenosylcobinamide amidohydrolase [Candidatus Bathyarchaeota archaeon]|nr:adenosylcobinamide amidohydrolase [Candidatus Bathyarchaeota archaeon]